MDALSLNTAAFSFLREENLATTPSYPGGF